MAGNRLFNPNDSLAPRDPQDNGSDAGMIVNPPRYAQLGGLSSAGARGISKNAMSIRMPGSTQHKEPIG